MTKFIKTLSIFCFVIPAFTQAQVRHELRECDHEITREKREARREVRHADTRYEARQERREGQREIARAPNAGAKLAMQCISHGRGRILAVLFTEYI